MQRRRCTTGQDAQVSSPEATDLGQQCHRIETAIGLAQPTFDRRRQPRVRQCPRIGGRRHVVALDHFGALAPLLLELERGLEEFTRSRAITRAVPMPSKRP